MGELDGKVAVITGAGSGMARASTEVFVREGAKVLAADISGGEEETAAELGDAVVPFRVDVTKEAEVEAMFAAARRRVRPRRRGAQRRRHRRRASRSPTSPWTSTTGSWPSTSRACCSARSTASRAMLPTGGGVIVNWSSIGGMNASRHADERVLGGEGGRHRRSPRRPRSSTATQGIRGERDLPGLHRDRDVGRPGRGASSSPR